MLLEPSRYEELNGEAVAILEEYGFTTFPLDVFALAKQMGIVLRSYSSIPAEFRPAFEQVSNDAFTISPGTYRVDTTFICYNSDAHLDRLRQSIAHEIAHIWLEHPSSEEPYETEAEYFAAYMLAPIPLIIDCKLMTSSATQKAFLTSHTAACISVRRAINRLSCNKPLFDYERRILKSFRLKEGDDLESS